MKKPERASLRIASKVLKKKATSKRKLKEISSLVSKGKVWSAVRRMYVPKNSNVSSREGVSAYFQPSIPRYNASKNAIIRNTRSVKKALNTALANRSIVNMIIPMSGKTEGVNPDYIKNAYNSSNVRYATIGRNRKLKAFAFLKSTSPGTRYLNVIGAFPGYGSSIMNRVLSNAKKNGKKSVNLKAVTTVNSNNHPLVKWYLGKGFVRSGPLNVNESLLPMRYTVR